MLHLLRREIRNLEEYMDLFYNTQLGVAELGYEFLTTTSNQPLMLVWAFTILEA